MVKVIRLTEPASEPVTTTEAKARIDVVFSDDDTQIADLISAARRAIEDYCNRPFVEATWAVLYGGDLPTLDAPLCVPLKGITAVTQVTYKDTNGTTQTWAESGNWIFDAERQEITPDDAWPDGTDLRIAATAGNGDSPLDIPGTIKQAILFLVWDYYEPHDELQKRAFRLADPYRERLGL